MPRRAFETGEEKRAQAHGVEQAYDALVAKGALSADEAQRQVVRLLDDIANKLAQDRRAKGWLGRVRRRAPVRGAYVYGDVGRGKTMLMDLFFSAVDMGAKRRVHFHQFMDEVHTAIAEFRQSDKGQAGRIDPIDYVTRPIIRQTRLLCLDEFHVNDITNAMILKRLFDRLFDGGVVLVATSNVAPGDLYHNGLNRQLFMPFIATLERHAHVQPLDADHDYRRNKFGAEPVFACGLSQSESRAQMDGVWARLTGGAEGEPGVVSSLGRKLVVPRQALGVARFSFAQLCEAPLGARDYLRLVHAYDTFIVDDVPQLDRTRANAAKRFILLVDTLYDRGAKLAASFRVPLAELCTDDLMAFEFKRTHSRLLEMQTRDYLAAPLRAVAPKEAAPS